MTNGRKTIREEISEMRATQEVRYELVSEERKEVKRDIKTLSSNFSTMRSDITGISIEVKNLGKNMGDLKVDIKDSLSALGNTMDTHFNGKSRNNHIIKKGAIAAGVPTGLLSITYGLYEFGRLVGLWEGLT